MKPTSGTTLSVWAATADTPAESSLTKDLRADVCIIGAGIAGMTTAYLLGKEGKSVIVLDDGPIGGGQTARTTAHLTNALDDRFFELERLFGEKGSQLAAESHTAAIDRVEEVVGDEKIDCEFVRLDGYLFLPPGASMRVLDDELPAAHRAGLPQVRRIDRAPLESFDTGPCLHFPRQAQFHPLKYLSGLALAIGQHDGRIFSATHVSDIQSGSVTTTNGHTVEADSIVVATNCPVNDRVAIHTKQAPYTTYVIGARIEPGAVPTMLLWDAPENLSDPYHYIRIEKRKEHDVLIVGGEDHKTGQQHDGVERWRRLEEWTRERFPIRDVEFHWSGQVMEPVDSLAFIGRNPGDKDIFIATGDSGMGMTHGTIAGMLITDLIMNRHNRWAELYDPSRKTLVAGKDFAKENINVAAQYTDLVTPGDVASVDEIALGEGAVIRKGMSKVAVYKDEGGKVHSVSAICVHLGCVVTWNGAEKTWDCPCHGSRFDCQGGVINGPANKDLPVEELP
jgi:glycine/D-amino acid oxidase-like deaminating enzyme/nitrite reductase/ring-hydroxylating ferredoxin subunit